MPDLPFARLNLRYNPFGELPPEERGALAVVDLDPILADLSDGVVVELLGPCGHGKTTHLLALHPRLPGSHYTRAVPRIDARPCDVLLLDEADHAWSLARWAAARKARRVVAATHRPLRWPGWRVHTRPVAGPDPATAIARRIEAARRGPGPVPRVVSVQGLVRRHGHDMRAMMADLYDRFQHLEEIADVEV